jgi:hypothetical protein
MIGLLSVIIGTIGALQIAAKILFFAFSLYLPFGQIKREAFN